VLSSSASMMSVGPLEEHPSGRSSSAAIIAKSLLQRGVILETMRNCAWLCRCFAALGDVSKARYLHETNRVAEEAAKTMVSELLHSVVEG